MALQIRRGTNAERQQIIPLQGELIFTTDTKKLYVGDGTTLGGIVVDTTGSGGEPDGNTTYSISAITNLLGADITLLGSDESTDSVTLAAGDNVTIVRTDENTITISSTGGTGGGAAVLNDLTDVALDTENLIAGQVLKYDGSVWYNATDENTAPLSLLDDFEDVSIDPLTLSPGQALKWNGTIWTNQDDSFGGGGGAETLDELADVSIEYPELVAGQILSFDGTQWVNITKEYAIDDLTDVVIFDPPTIGQVIKHDGNTWVNQALNLDEISEISIDLLTIESGQTLVWDGANWINSLQSLTDLSDVNVDPLTLTSFDLLVYDGNEWINSPLNISYDENPSLGGSLNLNNFDITGEGNIDIIGSLTLTSSASFNEINTTNFSGLTVTSEIQEPLTIRGIMTDGQSIEVIIQAAKGTLDNLQSTLAGDVITSFQARGWVRSGPTTGDWKLASNIASRWAPSAVITNKTPASELYFVTNSTTDEVQNYAIFDSAGTFSAPIIKTGVYTSTPETRPTGVKGMIIFDDTTGRFQGYNGTTWVDLNT